MITSAGLIGGKEEGGARAGVQREEAAAAAAARRETTWACFISLHFVQLLQVRCCTILHRLLVQVVETRKKMNESCELI